MLETYPKMSQRGRAFALESTVERSTTRDSGRSSAAESRSLGSFHRQYPTTLATL